MPDSPPDSVPVSVAIPAYQNAERLGQTLQCICQCQPLPSEILIHADNGWAPPSEILAGHPVPVRVVTSPVQRGPGGGRHVLFLQAACEIIASFDDDSWPIDTDYFSRALAVMEAFPRAAVMSPAVYLREKPVQAPMLEVSKLRSFEGSASITRKSLYLQLPGYVPVPAAYGVEEADLCLQIHAAGFEILSCPWLRAWHERPYADNRHTVLPWIRNEVLLAYLRFPRIGQPWGWLRAVRHVISHRREVGLMKLLRELALAVPYLAVYQGYVRRYTLRQVVRHHLWQEQRFILAPMMQGRGITLQVQPAPAAWRVLFVQYTNPGGYPPLEHASRILARNGWEVEFCGTRGSGAAALQFAPHPRVRLRLWNFRRPGLGQKWHYLRFTLWCVWRVLRWRPHWVYGSDALSTPALALIRRFSRSRILYHEHDSPVPDPVTDTRFQLGILRTRLSIGRSADVVVLPNQKRLEAFLAESQSRTAAFCVWNCPSLDEVPAAPPLRDHRGPLRVLYHGSIVPERFGFYVLEALAACGVDVQVTLMGYFPLSRQGYKAELMAAAARLGVEDRFEYLGAIPQRSELMRLGAKCHVGLCLLRIHEGDINMQNMSGASNKPFDYLSQGIALIVPPDPGWEELYVNTGCAVSCPSHDAGKLAELFRWMDSHREEVAEMGARGHARVLDEWHYEKQFAPVLSLMQSESSRKQRP